MMEALLALLKQEQGMVNASAIVTAVSNLVRVTEQNVLKEGVTKNAFIDSLIQLLQAHKDAQA